ncbi:MAG: ribosome-associated translation inhibitor RaiA [Chlorobiales bacterium]|jgi:putative sigma-54 modulation protein|nr:ribosome-associated translation inhibitor RaiA [Chlorobiales bacterium]
MGSTKINGTQMTIQFTLRHSSNHKEVEAYARNAVVVFDKFYDGILECQIVLDHQKHDKEHNKIAEIMARVPEHTFIAKEAATTYELAIDACVSSVCRQLQRHKEKARGI